MGCTSSRAVGEEPQSAALPRPKIGTLVTEDTEAGTTTTTATTTPGKGSSSSDEQMRPCSSTATSEKSTENSPKNTTNTEELTDIPVNTETTLNTEAEQQYRRQQKRREITDTSLNMPLNSLLPPKPQGLAEAGPTKPQPKTQQDLEAISKRDALRVALFIPWDDDKDTKGAPRARRRRRPLGEKRIPGTRPKKTQEQTFIPGTGQEKMLWRGSRQITALPPIQARRRLPTVKAKGHADVVSKIAADKKKAHRSKRSPALKAIHHAIKKNCQSSAGQRWPSSVSRLISDYAEFTTPKKEPDFVVVA